MIDKNFIFCILNPGTLVHFFLPRVEGGWKKAFLRLASFDPRQRKTKMQHILFKRVPAALILASLMLVGCAMPTSVIDLYETRAAPEDEAIIFGRVKVIENEKTANLSSLLGESTFSIIVLPDGSSKGIYHRLHGEGYFYWHLPQGGYSIAGFEWMRGSELKGRIFAHFNAPRGKTVTYIGTLGIRFDGGRYTKFIEDEYEIAVTTFKKEFPEIKGEFTRNLMRMEKER